MKMEIHNIKVLAAVASATSADERLTTGWARARTSPPRCAPDGRLTLRHRLRIWWQARRPLRHQL